MKAQNMGSCVFWGAIFPQKIQNLGNGESNKKNDTNKKDGKFNFLKGMCYQIQCISNQYRVITITPKHLKKLKKPYTS